jgi:hypothetical protein
MSMSPRLASQHRAWGSATVKQVHRQASSHSGLAIRATTTQACAREGEDPNGGPRRNPSSGQGSGSHHYP